LQAGLLLNLGNNLRFLHQVFALFHVAVGIVPHASFSSIVQKNNEAREAAAAAAAAHGIEQPAK
jgi:hypothetical protein